MKTEVTLCDLCPSMERNFAKGACELCGRDICDGHSRLIETPPIRLRLFTCEACASCGLGTAASAFFAEPSVLAVVDALRERFIEHVRAAVAAKALSDAPTESDMRNPISGPVEDALAELRRQREAGREGEIRNGWAQRPPLWTKP